MASWFYRFGLIVRPLRLIIGSSVAGVVVIDSLAFTLSTDAFRGLTLFAAFGVEDTEFDVTIFAVGVDFNLAEPLGFKIHFFFYRDELMEQN